jgi:hypothetical protein
MKLATELTASLREFAASGAELLENGGRLAPLSQLSWEVRGADDKPLLHIWSEEYNLTRRVIAITDHSEARLVLAVERFGRARPGRLEFVRSDFERPVRELLRSVTVHPSVASREVFLRYRGLPFARWDDGKVYFGCNDAREELTGATRLKFERMLEGLQVHRHPLATDTRHAWYRAQPERRLEAIVRNNVTRVDAALDARFVYTQVFAG